MKLKFRGAFSEFFSLKLNFYFFKFIDGKLETLMESNKYNLNIRALTSEDAFNAYKSYFKSILNLKPFTNRLNIHSKMDDLTSSNNNNNNRRKYKYSI